MKDSKTSFDFYQSFKEKLVKLVDDFMVKAGKTRVRIPPTPQVFLLDVNDLIDRLLSKLWL